MTVCLRVYKHLLREKEACKETLPLQEHVIFLRVIVMIWVLDAQDIIPEARNHEELLIQGIHIADTAEILDTYMTSG